MIEDENESRLKEYIKDEDQERSGRECESLSQNIRRNLTELRQQQEVLIIDDDNEAEIRSSIVEDTKQVKKEEGQRCKNKDPTKSKTKTRNKRRMKSVVGNKIDWYFKGKEADRQKGKEFSENTREVAAAVSKNHS